MDKRLQPKLTAYEKKVKLNNLTDIFYGGVVESNPFTILMQSHVLYVGLYRNSTRSVKSAVVVKVGEASPVENLNPALHVAVLEPVPSCVIQNLIAFQSVGLVGVLKFLLSVSVT